jgi:DNA-binding transcriptional LysR family regulator
LALGASTTIAQYVLPRLLGEFCKEHPRVHPTLISGANASNSPATPHRHGLTLFSAPSPHGT